MGELEDRLARALKSFPVPEPLASGLAERAAELARRRARRRRWTLASVGAVIAAGLAVALPVAVLHGDGGGGRVTVSADPSASASGGHSSAASTCGRNAMGTVRTVTVPALVGQNLSQATGTARAASLTVVSASAPSAAAAGTVIAQNPAAGTVVASGSTLSLTVAASPAGSASTTTGTSTTAKAASRGPAVGGGHCAPSSPTTTATAPGAGSNRTNRSCAHGGVAFELSLASSTGGQPTPVAAAAHFARHNSVAFRIPRSGWSQTAPDANGATVVSGAVTLHTVEGSDRTWQVDGGNLCR